MKKLMVFVVLVMITTNANSYGLEGSYVAAGQSSGLYSGFHDAVASAYSGRGIGYPLPYSNVAPYRQSYTPQSFQTPNSRMDLFKMFLLGRYLRYWGFR